jgi:hypothetical protein
MGFNTFKDTNVPQAHPDLADAFAQPIVDDLVDKARKNKAAPKKNKATSETSSSASTAQENIQPTQEGQIVFGDRYLRHRPFLVVTQKGNAAKHVNTAKAGWAKDGANWDVTERPVIVDRVSDKMLTEASIIIDLLNSTLVKNRFQSSGQDTKVLEYYLGKYSQEVTEGIKIWTSQMLGKQKAAEIMTDSPLAPPSDEIREMRAAAEAKGSAE